MGGTCPPPCPPGAAYEQYVRRKEGADANESTREEEYGKANEKMAGQPEGLSKRRDCRRRKCTNMLHGGVCHRAATPHKSGNKEELILNYSF